jgi:hypothetical protein
MSSSDGIAGHGRAAGRLSIDDHLERLRKRLRQFPAGERGVGTREGRGLPPAPCGVAQGAPGSGLLGAERPNSPAKIVDDATRQLEEVTLRPEAMGYGPFVNEPYFLACGGHLV